MNKVVLLGRLTRNPEIRYGQSDGDKPKGVARYTLAVRKRFHKEGEPEADFINCVAFGANAEFAQRYLKQGSKICISGRIQTGSYEKDNQRIYTTVVVVEEHEFAESKASAGGIQNYKNSKDQASPYGNIAQEDIDQFMKIPDGFEEVPFI